MPITDEELLKHSGQFEELWLMPHAVGALDKKAHCVPRIIWFITSNFISSKTSKT